MNIGVVQDASVTRVVVTVHGIRTFGRWQERLGQLLVAEGFDGRLFHFKYGYFSSFAFLIPPLRFFLVLRFVRYLRLLHAVYPNATISFAAHSFGTHLVGWALYRLSRKDRYPADVIVLAGSVLKPNFRWNDLISRGSVRVVLNECGNKDVILVLNQLVAIGTGMAGRLGFIGLLDDRFVNSYFEFGHSGYFVTNRTIYDAFMRERWVTLLAHGIMPPQVDQRTAGGPIAGAMTWLLQNSGPVKIALYSIPLVIITILSLDLYLGGVARKAAAEATSFAADTPDLALLLAVESSNLKHNVDSEAALLNVLQSDPAFEKILFGPSEDLADISYSHSGETLAVSDRSGCIYFYAVITGAETDHMCLPTDTVGSSIAFALDDSRLLIGGLDGSLYIWNLLHHRFDAQNVKAHGPGTDEPTVFLPLPDGRRAVSTSGDSVLKIWNLEPQLVCVHRAELNIDPFSMAIHPDGRHIVFGGAAGDIALWDLLPNPHGVHKAKPHGEIVYVGLNRAGTILASTERFDAYLRLWDPLSFKQITKPLTLVRRGGTGVAFSPKDKKIIVSNSFETISLFEDLNENYSLELQGVNVPFALSPDGDHVAAGLQSRKGAALLDLRHSRSFAEHLPTRDASKIVHLSLSRDGRTLAVLHESGSLFVENVESGNLMSSAHLDGAPFGPIVAFNDDNRVIAAAFDNTVCTYDVENAAKIKCVDVSFKVKSLAPDTSGSLFVVGGVDGTVRLVLNNGTSPKALGTVNRSQEDLPVWVLSVAFSRDGHFVALGGSDGEVDLLDSTASNPQIIQRFTGHANAVFGLCFDKRGETLGSVSSDGTLRFWKVSTGAQIGLPIPTGIGIQTLACSSDFVTVSTIAGRLLYLYNTANDRMVAEMSTTADFPRSLSMDDSGQIIAVASEHEILVWNLRPEFLRDRACRIANRNLTSKEWNQYVSPEIPCREVCPSLRNSAACK